MLKRDEDWKDIVDQVKIRDTALADCQLATTKFWEKIK